MGPLESKEQNLCPSYNCSAVPTKNTKENNSTNVILSIKVSS